MDPMQRIVRAVKREIPAFNDLLLTGLRKAEVGNLPEFIADRYRECCKVADPGLQLLRYEILSPIDRFNYELGISVRPDIGSSMRKNTVNIKPEEAQLICYVFQYYNNIFSVPL